MECEIESKTAQALSLSKELERWDYLIINTSEPQLRERFRSNREKCQCELDEINCQIIALVFFYCVF
jgi:hypothetical protein